MVRSQRGETSDLAGMVETGASLEDSVGPFLQTGDVFTQRLALMEGEDVRIRMAFPAQPEPAMVDDLQLRVRLEDGTILLPDRLREGGFAPTVFYPEVADTNDTAAFPSTNETVVGIDIPQSYLFGSSYIDVDVTARFVQPGGEQGTTGLDGDAVGFALIVKGVDRDSRAYDDDDGDGVLNKDDPCPSTYAPVEFDADRNGCLDDDDGDGCRTGTMRALRALPLHLTTQIETGAWTMTTGTAFPTPKTCARPSPSLLLLM